MKTCLFKEGGGIFGLIFLSGAIDVFLENTTKIHNFVREIFIYINDWQDHEITYSTGSVQATDIAA